MYAINMFTLPHIIMSSIIISRAIPALVAIRGSEQSCEYLTLTEVCVKYAIQ